MIQRKLIVGLGNPGKNYEGTRHNLGFLVVDRIAEDLKLKFKSCSFTEAVAVEDKANHGFFLKPMTFVNQSGLALRAFADYYKVEPQDILVVCDDLSLAFGDLRIRANGSPGGHNGLKSITEHLGTQDFSRLRLGIAHPGDKAKVVDYVLEDFSTREKKQLNGFIDEAAECCLVWLNKGIHQAMNQYNSNRRKEK